MDVLMSKSVTGSMSIWYEFTGSELMIIAFLLYTDMLIIEYYLYRLN